MDAKQEHSEIYEHDIKTEPVFIYGQADENSIFIKPEKFKSDDEDELGDSIFESQVTEQLISVDKFKQDIDYEVPKTEELSEYPAKIDHDLVTEHVNIFPITTVKQEIEDTIKFEVIDIGDSDIKQDVCEYVHFKNESELLTSHCDLPTLKSEDENNDNPDYLTQPCSSSSTADDSKNCSKEHPCIDCQKNYHPSSHSGLNQIDGGHLCYKQISDPLQLSNRVTISSNRTQFKCNICFKEFNKQFRLKQHLIIHSNEKPFQCYVCSRQYKRKAHLKEHLQIHTIETSVKCDICSKEFKKKTTLKDRLIIYSDKKPFICDICSKDCDQKYQLKEYSLIHTEEELFDCDMCSKQFNRKSNLRRHLEIHTNENPFKCNICSKAFKHKSYLHQHLLIHTNGKPFKCDICSKEFNQKTILKSHLIIHANKKPFKCDICSKEFARKYVLKQHLLIHTKKSPFKC